MSGALDDPMLVPGKRGGALTNPTRFSIGASVVDVCAPSTGAA